MEKVDNVLKWIFIIPATLAISIFTFLITTLIVLSIVSLYNTEYIIEIAICIIPICVSLAWTATSNLLAPKFKKEVTWLSFFAGCITALYITYSFIGISNPSNIKTTLIMFLSATIPSFLFCVIVQKETIAEKKEQDLFNTLDENL